MRRVGKRLRAGGGVVSARRGLHAGGCTILEAVLALASGVAGPHVGVNELGVEAVGAIGALLQLRVLALTCNNKCHDG